MIKQQILHQRPGGSDLMLGYNPHFNSSANEHFGTLTSTIKSDPEPMDTPQWSNPSGSRGFLDDESYPNTMRSAMAYPPMNASLANDVTDMTGEQFTPRWNTRYTQNESTFNPAFPLNSQHNRPDLIGHGFNRFPSTAQSQRPDVLSGASVGIREGRNFQMPLARNTISNVEWPGT